MLSEAYKTQAELEVQLNVAKSNLKLVIANNEMLEDALKQNVLQSKEVGWHRTNLRASGGEPQERRASLERSQSLDIQLPTHQEPTTPPSAGAMASNVSNAITALQDNRFFKFRFSTGYPTWKQNWNLSHRRCLRRCVKSFCVQKHNFADVIEKRQTKWWLMNGEFVPMSKRN